jgi:hypothetical protein
LAHSAIDALAQQIGVAAVPRVTAPLVLRSTSKAAATALSSSRRTSINSTILFVASLK